MTDVRNRGSGRPELISMPVDNDNSSIKYVRYRRSAVSEGRGAGNTDLSKMTDGVEVHCRLQHRLKA